MLGANHRHRHEGDEGNEDLDMLIDHDHEEDGEGEDDDEDEIGGLHQRGHSGDDNEDGAIIQLQAEAAARAAEEALRTVGREYGG